MSRVALRRSPNPLPDFFKFILFILLYYALILKILLVDIAFVCRFVCLPPCLLREIYLKEPLVLYDLDISNTDLL